MRAYDHANRDLKAATAEQSAAVKAWKRRQEIALNQSGKTEADNLETKANKKLSRWTKKLKGNASHNAAGHPLQGGVCFDG